MPGLNITTRHHMRRMCWYLKFTKDKDLVFNPPNKMVVDCYDDAYFAGLWGHGNPQDPICASSRTGFVLTFANFPLLWVLKYRQRLLFIHYILSMWHCLILLEH